MDLHKHRHISIPTLEALARSYYGLSYKGVNATTRLSVKWYGWIDERKRLTKSGLAVLIYHSCPLPHKAPPEVNAVPTDGGSKDPLDQVI